MKKIFIVLIASLIVFFLIFVVSRETKNNRFDKIPFSFNQEDFGKVEIKNYPKVTSESENRKSVFPIDLPEHTCFHLEDKKKFYAFEKGARYFSPSYSFICFIPTEDNSEWNFAKAYPNFSKSVEKLNLLIQEKPKKLKQYENIFDLPYNNSGWSVISKIQYLDYKEVEGVSFLTQYTQEMTPNPLNNEELTFNFQGLTKDKKLYIAARFAITHPNLPKGIDFTDDSIQQEAYNKPSIDEINKAVSKYLRKEEEKLESFEENTFKPSMINLKKLLESISIK